MNFPFVEQLADDPWKTTSDTETPGWSTGSHLGSDGVIGSFSVAGSGVAGVDSGVAGVGSGVVGECVASASAGVGGAASVVVVPPCHGVTTLPPLAAANPTACKPASSFLQV